MTMRILILIFSIFYNHNESYTHGLATFKSKTLDSFPLVPNKGIY
jgi:hypothetical protein